MSISAEEKEKRARILVEEFSGIYPPTEIAYIGHISSLTHLTLKSFSRFELLSNGTDQQVRPDELFETLQTAISHSAALSRFFWPPRGKKLNAARGARLRNAFQMHDTSPLKDRELRNAIEHYDEHLDEYFLDPIIGNNIAMHIGDNTSDEGDEGFIFFSTLTL